MAGKKRPLKVIVIVVLLVAVAAAAVAYYLNARRPQELVLSGTLEARTVNVGSLVGGRVQRVLIDEGSPVTVGQTIVTLETETIDRQIREQQAVIASAQANYAKAVAGPRPQEIAKAAAVANNDAKDRDRNAALYRQGIVPKETLDDAVTKAKASAEDLRLLQLGTRKEDIEAARAEMVQQQRHLDELLKQRAETSVVSSVNGTVQSFGLRPGDLVAANQSIAEILESSQLWVRVFVPETEYHSVYVGMPVSVTVDGLPKRLFHGRVTSVNPQGEYTPRNIQTEAQRAEEVFGVRVYVDPDPVLKSGMYANVDFGVKVKRQ